MFIFLSFSAFSATTASAAVKEAAKKTSVIDSISYLEKTAASLKSPAEKRSLYAFLGGVQEQQGLYHAAASSYAKAAAISAQDAAGMQKKSSEVLVLDAVRCALCEGDTDTAESYLNSAVRKTQNEEISAKIKLYEQWIALSRSSERAKTDEALAMLKTYSNLDSMKSVRPQLLFTLWYFSGDSSYSESLKKAYPSSMEAAVVSGKIQQLPSPFWLFSTKEGDAVPEIAGESVQSQKNEQTSKTEDSAKNEKATKEQLGLFKSEANAKALVERLKSKGFAGKITSEKRASGTTYYIVYVDENSDGTIGSQLRNAGFECYPLFD